ncbi:MAG TPA: sigma-70 family RNA polymerase sigma factor [Bacteroidales bacterium]|nr:sigma-70 family RNA polymerase sigma factor [Bacteroidales bacterium]
MFLRFSGKKSKNRTEEELIREFSASGDLGLLGELYSGYMHLVYGVCLKYLKSRDLAMDAVMQIFEKLITDIPKQDIDNFRGWLYVVTKNHCLMKLRSEKAEEHRFREWTMDPGNFMENDTYLHPIDREDNETDKDLADCIEKLKNEQKECICQFYYEDRSYSEIAVNLGIDEKKVKSYLQNGKRNLKICMEEKNEKAKG